MTLDEAIELINSDVVNYERLTEARKIATEALEKQIPKKPLLANGTKCPYILRAKHQCPSCYKNLYQGEKHCEHCGQAIDWSTK